MNNEQVSYKFRLAVITSLILAVVVFVTIYSFSIGSRMTLKYTPLIDAAMEIKLEATMAHLWLEELLTGDRDTHIDDIQAKIDSAIWYANAMLHGGSNDEGIFIALQNKEMQNEIEDVLKQLEEFKEITDKRFKSFQTEGRDIHDKYYDQVFYNFVTLADVVESRLQQQILEEMKTFNVVFYLILSGSVLFVLVIFFVVHHYEKERMQQQELYVQQARLASMGEMIGNIAHQWRQPLNALGLILQKIDFLHSRGKLDSTNIKENINKSKALIQGMSSTIDDFRDFFNPRKEKEVFDVQEAIEKAFSIVEPVLLSTNIEYRLKNDTNGSSVMGYKNELSQVIVNLLNNALEAFNEKDVAAPVIMVHIKKSDEHISIEVSDNAGGIPEEVLSKIFNPYFSTKSEKNGTGLGLYMSKTIIEEHMKGKLDAINVSGGACFKITIKSL